MRSFLLLIAIVLVATSPTTAASPYPEVASYELDVRFEPSEARIEGVADIRFREDEFPLATVTFYLHGELQVARAEVEALRGELLPQAERALDQTRSGFQRGRFSYMELASAQQDVLQTERAAIEAAGTVHRLHTEIERLTGEPLAAATPTR